MGKEMMEAVEKMVKCEDVEVAFVGEEIGWHWEKYVREVMERGLAREDAEKAIAKYCNEAAEKGEKAGIPYYRDEIVADIASRWAIGLAA